jgi:hypothetical protein
MDARIDPASAYFGLLAKFFLLPRYSRYNSGIRSLAHCVGHRACRWDWMNTMKPAWFKRFSHRDQIAF